MPALSEVDARLKAVNGEKNTLAKADFLLMHEPSYRNHVWSRLAYMYRQLVIYAR